MRGEILIHNKKQKQSKHTGIEIKRKVGVFFYKESISIRFQTQQLQATHFLSISLFFNIKQTKNYPKCFFLSLSLSKKNGRHSPRKIATSFNNNKKQHAVKIEKKKKKKNGGSRWAHAQKW